MFSYEMATTLAFVLSLWNHNMELDAFLRCFILDTHNVL